MAAAPSRRYRDGMDAVRDAAGEVASARNRLLACGGRACSDAELLGLVLDGGLGGSPACARAAKLLEWAGGIGRLERIDRTSAGLVGRNAVRRIAALRAPIELGRRAATGPIQLRQPGRDPANRFAPLPGGL